MVRSLTTSPRLRGDIPEVLERFRAAVDTHLKAVLPLNASGLYTMLRYHLGWVDEHGCSVQASTGKALRPALCLFACQALGGHWRQALPAAAALELLHNFSLIHDDIQDGDTERRHRPTVWSIWGQPQAISAGNSLCSIAHHTLLDLARAGVPDEVVLDLSATLTARYLEMIEGQYMDLSFEERLDVTVEEYLDMTSRKTGALIEAAMHMGAFIATRDKAIAVQFGQCGHLLGLAFQIRDDVLGIWGDTAATGKATGADIRRKKKSLPVVYTLERAEGVAWEALRQVYGKAELNEEDVAIVLEVMDRQETHGYAQSLAERKGQEALQALDRLSLEPWAREEIKEVASYLTGRER